MGTATTPRENVKGEPGSQSPRKEKTSTAGIEHTGRRLRFGRETPHHLIRCFLRDVWSDHVFSRIAVRARPHVPLPPLKSGIKLFWWRGKCRGSCKDEIGGGGRPTRRAARPVRDAPGAGRAQRAGSAGRRGAPTLRPTITVVTAIVPAELCDLRCSRASQDQRRRKHCADFLPWRAEKSVVLACRDCEGSVP